MQRLTVQQFEQIRNWVYRNARHLEITLWQASFEGGDSNRAVEALRFYQNGDGGFGRALEPDNWSPHSTPYTTLYAANLLGRLGVTDAGHPMIQGLLDYLCHPANRSANGWDFSLPQNDNYPRAIWWSYDAAANRTQSIGLTAGIASYLLSYGPEARAIALSAASALLDRLPGETQWGEMGAQGLYQLAQALRAAGLADRYPADELVQRAQAYIQASIERDPSRWTQYTPRPSRYIQSPDSPLYKGNEEIVAAELDFLLSTLQKDDVWDIPWTWMQPDNRYSGEFAVSRTWWKAILAIENVHLLQAFGRVDPAVAPRNRA